MVTVHIFSPNGSTEVKALPDSGAAISAAGTEIFRKLGEHKMTLAPSQTTPQATNGALMQPIGKIPVTFQLGTHLFREDLNVHRKITGVLLSWRAAKGLCILPECYPNPVTPQPSPVEPPNKAILSLATPVSTNKPPAPESMMMEFPTVFNGQINNMEGELFRISLTDDAKPFCVNTPRTIQIAYCEKLKVERDLLQAQDIIESVTEPTAWCAPIVVAPKKNSSAIQMCVDLSRLNRYVKRERYQSLTPAQAVADIAADKAQCPLDPESQLLTTFITPFGRFKFLRAPYGISSIP